MKKTITFLVLATMVAMLAVFAQAQSVSQPTTGFFQTIGNISLQVNIQNISCINGVVSPFSQWWSSTPAENIFNNITGMSCTPGYQHEIANIGNVMLKAQIDNFTWHPNPAQYWNPVDVEAVWFRTMTDFEEGSYNFPNYTSYGDTGFSSNITHPLIDAKNAFSAVNATARQNYTFIRCWGGSNNTNKAVVHDWTLGTHLNYTKTSYPIGTGYGSANITVYLTYFQENLACTGPNDINGTNGCYQTTACNISTYPRMFNAVEV